MDNESILKQFEVIENKVENLIEVCKSLKANNSGLKNEVNRLEQELKTKVEIENRLANEKALIRSKVDNLLARLGDITEES